MLKNNWPTPFFVAAIVGIILGVVSMSVVIAVQKHRIERDAERAEQMCVDPSGHFERECP